MTGDGGGVGVERDQGDAGEVFRAGQGGEDFFQHGDGEAVALFRGEDAGEALLGAVEFLDRDDGPDAGHSESARSRAVWARAILCSRVVIRVAARMVRGVRPAASAASWWSMM